MLLDKVKLMLGINNNEKDDLLTLLIEQATEEAVAYHPMTKAELIADLNEMCEEVKLIRAGKLKGQSWEDFKREVYIPTKN